jgi:hypothetical protein
MKWLSSIAVSVVLAVVLPLPCSAIPAEGEPPPDPHLNDPKPTRILVRVVAHGALVLGREVGGARVTITDLETKQVLATGIQEGEAGDQNQIMRTPHLMEEPVYSAKPAAVFTTTLALQRPTLVDVTAEGPLAYPDSMRRTAKTVLLIPGQDLSGDGIVLHLNGYIVQIEHPKAGESLAAKDDVKLKASVRTLSGTLVRPHGDWDSRKIRIYGELLIGERIVERLQLFYSNDTGTFDSPFFVPLEKEAPGGITLRVVAADTTAGNFSLGEARYPVLPERLRRAAP